MGEDYGSFDFSGFDNLDISDLLGGDSGIDFGSLDAGPGAMDLSGLEGLDLSALVGSDSGVDLSSLDLGPEAFDIASLLSGDSGGIDFGSLDAGEGAFDLSSLLSGEGGEEGLSRSLGSKRISLADLEKDTSGGTGLRLTGRGQMSAFDPITGATGITGEGFSSVEDLLGSGTAEEIARYTPGSADYSLRSGLETEGGQGFNADATRGMSLASMGGGQGLSKYIPAQYFEGSTTPIKGTGGTLSETGFLAQSSAANPLGSKYSLGDTKSFINNPTITGQQSVVSPGRTIIDNKDGTYKVVTNTVDGGTKTITTTKDGVDKIIRETKTIDNTKTNQGAKATAANKKDNNMMLALLALMAMMNKGGGSSTGSGGTIPSLTANRSQLPYGAISGSKARPGAGGVNYFSPTTYTQKAAGGGMMGGGISDLGGYSDGGRLLRGPGDGVSDSIPATIGGKQPARLAEGEFVVPARIVSELGNGSTEAGAKKLYAMMDRVQKARRKTKNVAADTKAHKYLPA
jgi:hypothetical protein